MAINLFRHDAETRQLLRGVYPILNVDPSTEIDKLLDWAIKLPEVGVKLVQVRAKLIEQVALPGLLDEIVNQLKGAGLGVILNDFVEFVGITGADGVHLGLDDFPVFEASAIVGPAGIVGATCRNYGEALLATGLRASYVAVGSVFESSTKPGIPILGTDGLREVIEHIDLEVPPRAGWGRHDNVPVCAIGGITKDNLKSVYEAGASMVAVIDAIQGAGDPVGAARELVEEWDRLESQE